MFWLALRSGYASDRAKSRPRVPPSCASAWLSSLMAAGSPGLAATFCSAAIALLRALMTASRLPLVAHVALDGFDQVRNQLVAAFELHVDLGEGVLEAVPGDHQPVVDVHEP